MTQQTQYNKNTMESYIADLIRRESNATELLGKLSTLYTDQNSQVIINFQNADGSISTFTLPSYNYLISEIRRTETNINQILSSTSNAITLTMPDGSTKVLYAKNTLTEPVITTTITPPIFFRKINNKIEDYLLNPMLCVQLPIDSSVRAISDDIQILRVVLDLSTSDKVSYFTQSLSGKNISHTDLMNALASRAIGYTEYVESIKLPHRTVKFSGSFDVLNIHREPTTILVGQVQTPTTQLVYTLNTLHYKDVSNNNQDLLLKINDKLVVNDGSDSTKYQITSIDTTTNNITLKIIQGNISPTIGVGTLVIDQDVIDTSSIEVPVSSNEYIVMFTKPINKYFDVVANDWGMGVGFYTSTLVNVEDSTQTLDGIYSTITNLKKTLISLSSEKYIPLSDGIKPNAPYVIPGNFKVQQSNAHKTDSTVYDDLKSKIAQKNGLASQIATIDSQIAKNKLSITSNTNADIVSLQQSNANLLTKRTSLSAQHATIITDVVTSIKKLGNNVFTPEYAVNGFWAQPMPKYGDDINKLYPQEVVQYVYAYRKLKPDNTSVLTQQIPYVDSSGNKLDGSFSPWVEVKTKARTKVVNADGSTSWSVEDTSKPDSVNSNQLAIPITQGESIEVRVKSLSEAGYPTSALESDWSDSIIVPFPQELLTNTSFDLTSANNEAILAEFQKYLNSIGLNEHLSDTLQVGTKTYKHDAKNISTKQRTSTNDIMNADDAIDMLVQAYNSLTAILNKSTGVLSVQITDETGSVLADVANNDTVKLFAGYYVNSVSSLAVPKGEIITKVFYIQLTNNGEADLEILSYVPGNVGDRLPGVDYTTGPDFTGDILPTAYIGYINNKTEYFSYRKYHRTPMVIKSIINDSTLVATHAPGLHPYVDLPAFQSMQNKGQLIYSRETDITLSNRLYTRNSSSLDDILLPTDNVTTGGISVPSVVTKPYVWNKTTHGVGTTGGGYISDFCVHTDHPDLQAGTDLDMNFSIAFDGATMVPTGSVGAGLARYPYFTHSAFFNLQPSDPNGTMQLEYVPYETIASGATPLNFTRKFGFSQNDKYLIGQNTCGAYLFLLPSDASSIYSGSPIYNTGKVLIAAKDTVRIPLVMQYRMTDYDGAGSTGTGIIGGYGRPLSTSNLIFTKTVGLDVIVKNHDIFSFDVQVTAQYKPDTVGNLRYVAPAVSSALVTTFPGL